MSALQPVTLEGISTVVDRMRDIDWTEISNQAPNKSRYAIAYGFYCLLKDRGRGRVGWYRGRPVLVCGLVEDWPGVWSICLFGTDEQKHVVYQGLKWIRLTIGEVMRDFRGHRLYADSRFDHIEAHRLLERMGGRRESVMPAFGTDGSTYYRYVWIRGDGQEAALSTEGQEVARDVRIIKQPVDATPEAGAANGDRLLARREPHTGRHDQRCAAAGDAGARALP